MKKFFKITTFTLGLAVEALIALCVLDDILPEIETAKSHFSRLNAKKSRKSLDKIKKI